MPAAHTAAVASNSTQIIVVRAWRNAGQLVIRVLAAAVGATPSQEWVFSDTAAAADKIAEILRET
jgi:hypothetical protein